MIEKIEKFKEYMKQEKFFEAHEVLEEYWFPRRKEKSKDVLIIKGFINAAVSLELKKRGRIDNYHKIWAVYKKFRKLIKEDDKVFMDLKEFVDGFKA